MEFLKNYFLTVKGILLSPKTFFSEIEWDSGWKEPLIFFSFSALIFALALSTTMTMFVSFLANSSPAVAAELKETGLLLYFLIYLGFSFGSMLISSQIISASTTFALHFLGGTGSFQRTFTALSCCWVVLLFSWIPLIGWIPALYFFYLAWLGLAKAHEVPGWKAITALVLGPGLVFGSIAIILVVTGLGLLFGTARDESDGGRLFNTSSPHMKEIMERYRKH